MYSIFFIVLYVDLYHHLMHYPLQRALGDGHFACSVFSEMNPMDIEDLKSVATLLVDMCGIMCGIMWICDLCCDL